MQQTKVKVNLGGIPQTSLGMLYVRAKISKEHSSLFNDVKGVELVEQIDYDFSTVKEIADYVLFATVARAIQFDDKVKAYIKEHPHASIVNLGAGFDTGFYRVDNGTIHWYDLDLPEVIEVRKQLLPETDRMTYIAKSFLDPIWCQDISTESNIFMIAGGLFRYFDEAEIRQFFSLLADTFHSCEVVFDLESKFSKDSSGGNYGAGWNDEPEKLDAMKAEFFKSLKNGWKILPQDLKDKMLCALTTPSKPHDTEWENMEAWWDQLNSTEKGEAFRDFEIFFGTACRWAMEDAREMTKWDKRIKVVDQLPLFRNIPRDPSLSKSIKQFMDYTDEKGRIKIVHLRI
jgi:O-methyltransferase involved in polyketide biosynthesis